jgi:hypothetical protein
MAQRYVHPFQQWFDKNGAPALGWKLQFYQTLTTTPLAVYADATLTTPLDNPVISESDGGSDTAGVWPVIFMQNAVYKVVLLDENDVQIDEWDPYDATLDSDTFTDYETIYVYKGPKPSAAEVYPIVNIERSLKLPATLTGGIFTMATNPTSSFAITLYKNSTSIGTITFNTSGVPTVSFVADVAFSAGDQFKVSWPGSQDATGAQIALTFVFMVL